MTTTAKLSGWSSRALLGTVLTVFVLFFAIPIVWLLFATTKTARGLVVDNPFRPGSLSALSDNWNQLLDYQSGAIGGWLANSAGYAWEPWRSP